MTYRQKNDDLLKENFILCYIEKINSFYKSIYKYYDEEVNNFQLNIIDKKIFQQCINNYSLSYYPFLYNEKKNLYICESKFIRKLDSFGFFIILTLDEKLAKFIVKIKSQDYVLYQNNKNYLIDKLKKYISTYDGLCWK